MTPQTPKIRTHSYWQKNPKDDNKAMYWFFGICLVLIIVFSIIKS